MSFKEHLGYRDDLIPRLATGFGGGIGRKGHVCGAVTGSVMAIGMRFGRSDPSQKESAGKVNQLCQRLLERFEKDFGNIYCYQLTGFHLDDPEELKQFQATGGREKCAEMIEKTTSLVFDLLEEG